MTISGFSMVKNGVKLYYPFTEAIRSILPICDEFVVAVGAGEDDTRAQIEAIGDPKIRIIDTVWEPDGFHKGAVNAIQTNIALEACTGDWLFYLQADEVMHERYWEVVRARCEALLDDEEVEGLLFRYRHFWADYEICVDSHAWYNREIRIVRRHANIRSYHDAQGFRWYDTYEHPYQESGTRKLKVARVDAEIYHYGWVRPPRLMQDKNLALHELYVGPEQAQRTYAQQPPAFHYGNVQKLPRFEGSHPKVMAERIAAMDWREELLRPPEGDVKPVEGLKHESLKCRVLTSLENTLFGGEQVFGARHYRLLKGK